MHVILILLIRIVGTVKQASDIREVDGFLKSLMLQNFYTIKEYISTSISSELRYMNSNKLNYPYNQHSTLAITNSK